jgi:hypothetical protein
MLMTMPVVAVAMVLILTEKIMGSGFVEGFVEGGVEVEGRLGKSG